MSSNELMAVGPRRELLSKISSAVTGYLHRDFARTRRASTRLLLVGDKPNLNSTSQRTDTPPRAECSLSSKSARYSQRLAPCERSTHAAQIGRASCRVRADDSSSAS